MQVAQIKIDPRRDGANVADCSGAFEFCQHGRCGMTLFKCVKELLGDSIWKKADFTLKLIVYPVFELSRGDRNDISSHATSYGEGCRFPPPANLVERDHPESHKAGPLASGNLGNARCLAKYRTRARDDVAPSMRAVRDIL